MSIRNRRRNSPNTVSRWPAWADRPFPILLALGLVAACSSGDAATVGPAEADIANEPPYGPGVGVGDEYDYVLYVHCGVQWARIDGDWFETEPLNDGNANPPPGWGNPFDKGSLTIVDLSTAEYRSDNGETLTFVRTEGGAPPPCE